MLKKLMVNPATSLKNLLLHILSFPISAYTISQNATDIAAQDTAQALEFELHEDAGIVVFYVAEVQGIVVYPLSGNHTDIPAAVAVFDPGNGFEVPLVGVIIIPAPDEAPIAVEGPHTRHITLIDGAVLPIKCRG